MRKPEKNRELELKLEIEDSDAGAVWRRAISAGIAASEPAPVAIRSIYFDTPDLALHGKGISLRLREKGGGWIQTVKLDASLHGGLSNVTEISNPVAGVEPEPGQIPDKKTRKTVLRLASSSTLGPVCETHIERCEGEVVSARGTRALLTVDSGKINAGVRSAGICEIEIEYLDGPPRGLFDIAKIALPPGPVRFSTLSKGVRGIRLATEGSTSLEHIPRPAQAVPLDESDSIEAAAKRIFRECAQQIATNVNAVMASADPEGPHQLRIGLRRLRTALSIFAARGSSQTAKVLADEARWLGREVGKLRDLDVVAGEIVPCAGKPDPGNADLAEALLAKAGEVRLELRQILSRAHVRGFLLDLMAFIETESWRCQKDGKRMRSTKLREFAGNRLDKRTGKISKQVAKLAGLSVEEKHELRKELKKLRYTVEFLSPLYKKKKVKPYLSPLKQLQDTFGAFNDFHVAQEVFKSLLAAGPVGAEVQKAIDRVMENKRAEAERTRQDGLMLSRKFAETDPFWR